MLKQMPGNIQQITALIIVMFIKRRHLQKRWWIGVRALEAHRITNKKSRGPTMERKLSKLKSKVLIVG